MYNYQWDAESHMVGVYQSADGSLVSLNTYNALGQRVEDMTPTSTTDEAYGAGGNLLLRFTGDSNSRSFVPFNGRILAEYYCGGMIFDHSDEIGSITTGTDCTGNAVNERLFYPFGESWTGYALPTLGMHQEFAQLPDYDAETDQYNTLNRHYSPQGRWMSPDPGGLKAVKLDDPQTWNMYAYVRNNPTTRIDPTGLDDITYDQSGNEIDRKKRGFWHNLFVGDTWKLKADSGNTYKLDDALTPLKNGQKYSIISQQQTSGLLANFLTKNATAPGSPGAGPATVLQNSPTGQAWDFKNTSDVKSLGRALFLYTDNNLYHADYLGNLARGYIMASNGWPETVSKAGAGLYQLKEAGRGPVAAGPAWSYYDDPRDTEAIGRGYDLWNSSQQPPSTGEMPFFPLP
jgi:RHS repeat-associated protein